MADALPVREILIARPAVYALPATVPASDGLRRLVASGHSRAPVTRPVGLDDVVGVVHIRDLVDAEGTIGEHAHPAVFLPQTQKVSDAMREMRQHREVFAVVVDERGASTASSRWKTSSKRSPGRSTTRRTARSRPSSTRQTG